MIFALASFGTRGSVEPCAAVGRELLHRGHEVRMAVPPDLVGFAEAAGLAAVASGPDAHAALDRDFTRNLFGDPAHNLRIRNLIRLGREYLEFAAQCWGESSTTLTSLADGADLLLTGGFTEAQAANVAEFYDIPLATLHPFPLRANGQFLPFLPSPLGRCAMAVLEWLPWRPLKKVEDAQRLN
jgi:UDP:flavonoid glycosyltransferase YjiC (YdhE family)